MVRDLIWIARLNVQHFQRMLETCLDDETRARVCELLIKEEAKLAALEAQEDGGSDGHSEGQSRQ
jgi:hypothetical protein